MEPTGILIDSKSKWKLSTPSHTIWLTKRREPHLLCQDNVSKVTSVTLFSLIKLNEIWIVITLFRLICNQTEFYLVPNVSENVSLWNHSDFSKFKKNRITFFMRIKKKIIKFDNQLIITYRKLLIYLLQTIKVC